MRIDWRHFRYVIFWRKTNHNLFTACKKLPNSTRQEGKLRGKRLTFSPRILAIRMATRFLSTVFDKNYIWYRRASRSWKQIMQLQDNPVRTKTEIKSWFGFYRLHCAVVACPLSERETRVRFPRWPNNIRTLMTARRSNGTGHYKDLVPTWARRRIDFYHI